MTVTTKTWSPDGLWPPAPFPVWLAPGAQKSTDANFGPGHDMGELRLSDKKEWEILWTRLPDQSNQTNHEWRAFDPSNPSELGFANRFNRYGAGHSGGAGFQNQHGRVLDDLVKAAWFKLFGKKPSAMDLADVQFNRALAGQLLGLDAPDAPNPSPAAPALEAKVDKILAIVQKLAGVMLLAVMLLPAGGCAGLGQNMSALFTGAKLSDAQLSGFAGEPEPIIVTGPDGKQVEIGCYLPLNILGEEEPLKVMLVGKYRTFCDVDLNRKVTVNGKPDPGGVINPTRINPQGINR